MPDPSQWPAPTTPFIAPLEVKRTVGRPPRNRRRQPGEERKGKKSVTVKCSKCNQLGHNKRACMGGLTAAQQKAAGGGQNRKKRANEEGISTQSTETPFPSKKPPGRKAKKVKKFAASTSQTPPS
ncbi:hypothetical protein RDABS01_019232 [Bienertia sinuspersici]